MKNQKNLTPQEAVCFAYDRDGEKGAFFMKVFLVSGIELIDPRIDLLVSGEVFDTNKLMSALMSQKGKKLAGVSIDAAPEYKKFTTAEAAEIFFRIHDVEIDAPQLVDFSLRRVGFGKFLQEVLMKVCTVD